MEAFGNSKEERPNFIVFGLRIWGFILSDLCKILSYFEDPLQTGRSPFSV
jgi:hypothetical protein